MAVPKKRKSKSKSNSRKHIWKRHIVQEAAIAISLAKALLGEKSKFLRVNPGAMFKPVIKPVPKQPVRKKATGRKRTRKS